MKLGRLALVLGFLSCTLTAAQAAPPGHAAIDWPALGRGIAAAAEQERMAQGVPSIAIGLVDKTGLVWSMAVGNADAAGSHPADARTTYRVGSVSKLFTDILVMQQVERGVLALDAPVQNYLPDFKPHNSFGVAITLRQLMSHRSGLVREPPRGNYFDVKPATLAETVASLNATTLVAAPGTVTKYSNAGIAVVGRVLEAVTRKPFEQLLREALLGPLGMNATGLRATETVRASLAYSQLAPIDASRFAAPQFDLGMAPAGNLYSSLADMAQFARSLLNGGATSRGVILESATLEAMWQPQFSRDGERVFGIGFRVSDLDGHRIVGHGGAVYGFVTDFSVFADDGFAVIVMAALDEARHVTHRLRDFAARQVIAAQAGRAVADTYVTSSAIEPDVAAQIAGHYTDGTHSLDVRMVAGRSYVESPEGVAELRRRGAQWLLDDVTTYRNDIAVDAAAGTIGLGGEVYRRAAWQRPQPPEARFAALIGDYGFEHNYLRIYEKDGRPYVRIEWSSYEELERVAPDVYRFVNPRGLYALEQLKFTRDKAGRGVSVDLNGISFGRRDFGAELDARIKATVQGNSVQLRAEALKAQPPVAITAGARTPDLVEVVKLDPSVHLDIRYASTNNFMGIPFYESAQAFLQRPAAQALVRAHRRLAAEGYGILIHDGYRPWFVTRMFWDATPESGKSFVANPSEGSRHNRGCAADITLYELATGKVIEMPGRYDEMSARSSPLYVGGSSLQRWQRDLLKNAMEAEQFAVYEYEWWHFDYHLWPGYPVLNRTFRELSVTNAAVAEGG